MRQSIHILHVDDDSDFAAMAATFLQREVEEFRVRSATSASEGLDRLTNGEFDCIVSDYEMPSQNGIEFLQSVRETYPDLPFILYTGKGSEEIASEAISAGVTDYLRKGTGTSQYTVLANRIENAVAQYRAERSLEHTRHRYQRLIEESSDVFAIVDRSGCFEYISPSVTHVLGYQSDELLGEQLFEYIHPEDCPNISDKFSMLADDPSYQLTAEYRLITNDNVWRWVETRSRNLLDDRIVDGIVIHVRDISERKHRERVLKQLHDATRTLLRTETKQEAADVIGEAAKNVLGYSNNIVRLLSDDNRTLKPVTLVSENLPADIDKRPTYEVGEETAGLAFERNEPVVYDDVTQLDDGKERHGVRAGMYLPIGTHGVFTISEYEPGVFDETDVQLASILTTNAAIALDRISHEREQIARLEALTELNTRMTRLFRAETPNEICEITANTAREILGYSDVVVRVIDDEQETLTPIAAAGSIANKPMDQLEAPLEDGTAGRVYTSQKPQQDSPTESHEFCESDEHEEKICLPIGEYGTISLSGTIGETVDQSDIELGRLLAATTETAIYRVKQQRTVERQNEQLDKFISVVSHDLRNPLDVASGRLALLEEECECGTEHLAPAENAIDRMSSLIEDLLTMARENNADLDLESIDLQTAIEESWSTVETYDSTLLGTVDRRITADNSRLKQLLENLIRNSIEHGRVGGSTKPSVTVSIGELPGGFYIEDDGPGIPKKDRETVFDLGFSTSRTGTGFGLSIAKEIADAHGWNIEVVDGTDEGARFEITDV